MQTKFPEVYQGLIEALEKSFPNTIPPYDQAKDGSYMAFLSGQQSVIKFLRTKHENQQRK